MFDRALRIYCRSVAAEGFSYTKVSGFVAFGSNQAGSIPVRMLNGLRQKKEGAVKFELLEDSVSDGGCCCCIFDVGCWAVE